MPKQTIKPILWLLPYQAECIDDTLLRRQLAKNQQSRFDAVRGKRKTEFGITRLFLRHCLQQSLHKQFGLQTEEIEIIEQENLPPLVAIAEQKKIAFSISHSKQLIAIMIAAMPSKNSRLGLDVEQFRFIRNPESATLFCNEAQLAMLNQATSQEHDEHYYRFWTQKEAVLKARQSGIVDADLKVIEGVACTANGSLRSSHFTNAIDQSNYTVTTFCQEHAEKNQCQLVTLNEKQHFSLEQTIDLKWQNYQLKPIC